MMEWFNGLGGMDKTFAVCAAAGGIIFTIKFILMFIGADADVDFDADTGDVDGGMLWISTFSITAFIMMFGLGGLTSSLQFKLPMGASFAIAVVTGFVMILLLRLVIKQVMKLHSSGTMKVDSAIGSEGTVYLKIPTEGKGKVQLIVQGTMQTLDAVTDDNSDLTTGTVVEVVDVINSSILKVTKK